MHGPNKAFARVEELLRSCEGLEAPATLLNVDDPDLLLMGEMPQRINRQLIAKGASPLDTSPEGHLLLFR